MPIFRATISATLRSSSHSHSPCRVPVISCQFCMNSANTSYPACLSSSAATDESTPPESPTAILFPRRFSFISIPDIVPNIGFSKILRKSKKSWRKFISLQPGKSYTTSSHPTSPGPEGSKDTMVVAVRCNQLTLFRCNQLTLFRIRCSRTLRSVEVTSHNCMPCSTLFLYITDYKTIINHSRSFRPVFSGQEEHLYFSINCITASCKTTASFYLPLLPAVCRCCRVAAGHYSAGVPKTANPGHRRKEREVGNGKRDRERQEGWQGLPARDRLSE